uniref:CRISPR-associated RAMP protein n=1 Tax=Desulfatirhabdium butyrativorans TaxID=340467 RepID=A0A7C4ML54_9BACT
MIQTSLREKVRILGTLTFGTAFHIGSGKEGDLATDMGVIKDERGWPVLPGSTLKGAFRATSERLAHWLQLKACLMDTMLSGIHCVGDQGEFQKVNDDFRNLTSEKQKLHFLEKHTCDVCRLFGTPMHASRIFFSDGELADWKGVYQIRDGVVIDRDSHTARPKLKYDFEAVSKETAFHIQIDIENPTESELALVGAVVSEWQCGVRIGGFTSRGLGQAILENVQVQKVDFSNPDHLKSYLLKRQFQQDDQLLDAALENVLVKVQSALEGGGSC